MAKRSGSFVWIVVLVVIAVAGYKYGIPWYKTHITSSGGAAGANGETGVGSGGCVDRARSASAAWGDGIGRFTGPPYDTAAWESFRSGVEGRISEAESECGCSLDSCSRARQAMGDLGSLVRQIDGAIRGGTPVSGDVVRQQERIDAAIEEAKGLSAVGK